MVLRLISLPWLNAKFDDDSKTIEYIHGWNKPKSSINVYTNKNNTPSESTPSHLRP
jgi:hypothetical protein